MAVSYINSVGYAGNTAWTASAAKIVGNTVRQAATPAVGDERIWVALTAGTTGGTEPSWVLTSGSKTTDNTLTWMECTGNPGVNGDAVNLPGWSLSLGAVALGEMIHGTSNQTGKVFICTTAGAVSGSEPTWNITAGATTTSGTSVWTCLGNITNYPAFSRPHARLANALANRAAGDVQYVADNHAETQSTALAITFTLPPNLTYCVDRTVVPPTISSLKTTATLSTTGVTNMTITGNNYIYGISFITGSGAGIANMTIQNIGAEMTFEACNFILGCTGASVIAIGTVNLLQAGTTNWNNCSVQFSNAASSLRLSFGLLNWKNSTAILAGGTLPTNLFLWGGAATCIATGVDFSAVTSNIVSGGNSAGCVSLSNCLINAAATIGGTLTASNGRVYAQQVDSGSNLPRHEFYWLSGVQTTEEVVVHSHGATDGTTPISWKIVTNANGDWSRPFATYPIVVYSNIVNTPVTATVQIINDGVTFTNQDIWLEVEYFGSSSSTLTTLVSDGLATGLTTPTSQTGGAATWTTTGLTTPITQHVAVVFTPAKPGMIRATVKVGPNITVWVDPKLVLS